MSDLHEAADELRRMVVTGAAEDLHRTANSLDDLKDSRLTAEAEELRGRADKLLRVYVDAPPTAKAQPEDDGALVLSDNATFEVIGQRQPRPIMGARRGRR